MSSTSGKIFKGFFEQQTDGNFSAIKIPPAALDKLLGNFLKEVGKQNGGEYEPQSISSFQKAYPSYLRLARLPLFVVCLPPKTLQSRVQLPSNATSFFLRRKKFARFQSLFNPVQSASSAPGSFHQNAGKHQKLDTSRLKDPCTVFYRID